MRLLLTALFSCAAAFAQASRPIDRPLPLSDDQLKSILGVTSQQLSACHSDDECVAIPTPLTCCSVSSINRQYTELLKSKASQLPPMNPKEADTCSRVECDFPRGVPACRQNRCVAFAPPTGPTLDSKGAVVLSDFLNGAVKRGDIPGVVVLVTAPDRILYHEAFGKRNVAQGVPMRKDAIFRIASMTKAITSAAVMTLVEQGKLSLDDNVAKYLPAFEHLQVIRSVDLAAGKFETHPATRPITIRQLFTHTSGIGYAWSDPGLAMIQKLTGKTSEADLPLINEPGAQWTYGSSPKVLGEVAQKITGLPVDAFLKSRIFDPLAMTDTAYAVPASKVDRVPTLHQKKDGKLTETPNAATLSVAPRGDGGLFSTAADYARFVQMILNHGEVGGARVLQPATVAEMSRNQIGALKVRLQPTANADFSHPYPLGVGEDVWGLGFQIAAPAHPDRNLRRPGSLTWAGIDNTFYWIDPQARIGVIVLMQMLPFYDEAALHVLRGVEMRVYQHLR